MHFTFCLIQWNGAPFWHHTNVNCYNCNFEITVANDEIFYLQKRGLGIQTALKGTSGCSTVGISVWLQTVVFKGTVHPKHQNPWHIPVWSLEVRYLHQRKTSSRNNNKNTKYITDTEYGEYLILMQSCESLRCRITSGPRSTRIVSDTQPRNETHQTSGVCVGALLFSALFLVFKTLFFDQITFFYVFSCFNVFAKLMLHGIFKSLFFTQQRSCLRLTPNLESGWTETEGLCMFYNVKLM